MPEWRLTEGGRYAEAVAGLTEERDVELADLEARIGELSATLEDLTPRIAALSWRPRPGDREGRGRDGPRPVPPSPPRPPRSRVAAVCYAVAHGHPGGTAMSGADPVLPSARRIRALRSQLLGWYAENRRDLPWRRTDDPYAVLVSEIMLQQTQVPRVVPRFGEWLAAWPDLESLAAAPLADVLRRWQGLGYNNRARRLLACAQAAVAAAPQGRRAALPRTLDGLRGLPGVGPYTARAVLIFAHNEDLAAVDANVRRVLTHELELPEDLSAREVQAVADAALPRGRSRDWHNALMDHGSLVLTARRTGIASLSRQGAFAGSRRQKRARLLRRLLDHGPQPPGELAATLDLSQEETADLLRRLAGDGLVAESNGVWAVA